MKAIVEAKAARHRKFHWCRRPNGFSDLPIWRVVAQNCNMPLYQVLAFVNRLEELGNDAANHGQVRGCVEVFNPAEFGAALGMATDEAARIFAALEDEKIGWISFDHIASFFDRNPDRDEDVEEVRQRKRRQRSRDAIRRQLAKLAGQGKIDEAERYAVEITLRGISDAELFDLQNRLGRGDLSTCHGGHKVTPRDIVTVTPEKTTNSKEATVDNCGDGVRGGTEGPAEGASGKASELELEARRWVDSDGARMLVEYLQIRTALATTYIERWRRDLQDDVALKEIILGADKAGYIGARFHTIITEQWHRHVARKQHGPQLHLMPPRPVGLKKSG